MNETMLAEPETVQRILRQEWGSYCDLLDDEQIAGAVEQGLTGGARSYENPEGGANFDVDFALKTAVEAASLISSVIKIYRQLVQEKGNAPTSAELTHAVERTHKESSGSMVKAKLKNVVAAIIRIDD